MIYMDRALELAENAIRNVSPNPPVGALVVNDGRVVGEGWTQPPGENHAEIVALNQAKQKAKGSILYITLEPCCFHGRTPPCVEAIVAAEVKEVHVSILDPNPRVNGEGLKFLRNSGIDVFVWEQAQIAGKLIEAYKKYIINQMPFVTVKYAMSLDGKIASKTKDSKWISSNESRLYVQKMRSSVDAIMVGANTVRKDNPYLTVRDEAGDPNTDQPLRIIVQGDGLIDSKSNILTQPGNVVIAMPESKIVYDLEKLGAQIEVISQSNGKVDLVSLMHLLASKYEITNVLVEGGGKLVGALFDLNLVDKVAVFVSPIIIGGEQALTGVEGKGVDLVKNAFHLNDVEIIKLDRDFLIIGSVK